MLQRDDIQNLTVLEISLMPEGLLSALSTQDVCDLFAYLRQHGQVPALVNENNVNDFNSDSGFERWARSSPGAWEAKDGVLSGKASADRAEFVTSDFVADDFHLTFEMKLEGGAGASVAATIDGEQTDDGFAGVRLVASPGKGELHSTTAGAPAPSLSLPTGDWVKCDVQSHGMQLRVTAGAASAEAKKAAARTCFAFQVSGTGAQLHLRNVHLDPPAAK
jgi:hypothetical protein